MPGVSAARGNFRITFRRASLGDIQAVTEVTSLAYGKYVSLLGRKPEPMTPDHGKLIAEDAVWVLSRGRRTIGVIELVDETNCLLIYNVAIRPYCQRQGFGRCLLDWTERQAREAGHARLRLYTNALMAANVAMYRRLGYVETKREPRPGSTLVHMSKHLPGAAGIGSTDVPDG